MNPLVTQLLMISKAATTETLWMRGPLCLLKSQAHEASPGCREQGGERGSQGQVQDSVFIDMSLEGHSGCWIEKRLGEGQMGELLAGE